MSPISFFGISGLVKRIPMHPMVCAALLAHLCARPSAIFRSPFWGAFGLDRLRAPCKKPRSAAIRADDATMTSELQLRAHGNTDVGRARANNEDSVLVRPDLLLYVVADGAGGHASGEIASRLAVRSLENFFGATVRATHERPEFDRFGIPAGARRLSQAVLKANLDVIEIARSSVPHRGMGTTVVAACFSPRSGLLHVAHVGDSRCYRLRSGHLELMTQDHSLVTDVLEQRPDLDDDVIDRLPKNIVTRALGMDPRLRVSIRSHAVVPGDKYLLCSDGLSSMVTVEDLAETLDRREAPEALVERLIAIANAAGGSDNIAALVIECQGGHEHARPADSEPTQPSPNASAHPSEPELLILGIEDLDSAGVDRTEGLMRELNELFGRAR
ncbi:MAG: protein phosphatase 2C domain-containing protein [Polyangiaceae bacterium]